MGTYGSLEAFQEGYCNLTFDQTGMFEFRKGASLGDVEYGKGSFSIKNSHLILNYSNTPPKESNHHLSQYWKNDKDSIVVNLKTFDLSNGGIPLAYVNVEIDGQKEILNTDEKGLLRLKLERNTEDVVVSVSFVGYDKYKILLNKELNLEVGIYLVEEFKVPIKDQIESYEIIEMQNNRLLLKDKNGKSTL